MSRKYSGATKSASRSRSISHFAKKAITTSQRRELATKESRRGSPDSIKKEAEQGARANAGSRHAACCFTNHRNETPDSKFLCRTRRAGHGRGSSLTLGEETMFTTTPKCRPIGAPSMAVPPEPVLVMNRDLRIAYRSSPESDEEEKWVVVRFPSFLHVRHGYPNDEALEAHPLAKHGLKSYDVFEVERSPLIEEIKKRNSVHPRHTDALFAKDRHWV